MDDVGAWGVRRGRGSERFLYSCESRLIGWGMGRLCEKASVARESHGLESRGCTLEGNF